MPSLPILFLVFTVMRLDQNNPKAQHIRRQISNRGIAWGKAKGFYSSDRILYPSFGIAQELYDAKRSYVFGRMAKGRSISYPSLSADAQHLYFVERKGQERLLKVAALRGSKLASEKVLLRVKHKGILQYTATSPDGSYLAVLWRPDAKGFAKLVLCKLTAEVVQSCQAALQAKAIITQPCFSQDSKRLFFSSDVDGVYNLYALNIDKAAGTRKALVHRLNAHCHRPLLSCRGAERALCHWLF